MPRFTEEILPTLVELTKVPKGKRDVLVFDDAMPAFFIRKFESGKASFGVQFRVGRQQRRMSLGPVVPKALAQARKAAHEAIAHAKLGKDLVKTKKADAARGRTSVGTLIPKYLEARETAPEKDRPRPRTLAEVKRYLEGYWTKLHGKGVDLVTRDDVVDVLNDIEREHGPVAADRAKAALGGFYAWALDRHCKVNPTASIGNRAGTKPRERVLSEAELLEVWHACDDDDFGKIVKVLILTALRRNEAGGLRWTEFNDAEQILDIPAARMKGRLPHVVALSKQALVILKGVERWEGRDYMFGRGKEGYGGWSKSKGELDARIAAARAKAGVKETLPAWTLHDLRRSTSTRLRELGLADADLVELILAHKRPGIRGTYDKSERINERRRALAAWGEHLQALVERRSPKVAALQRVG
jgi:integrase